MGLLLLPLPLFAQEMSFELDPAQSKIEFTLGATMHTVHGSFRLKAGVVRFDAATGAATGELIADARSALTGNDRRDRKMHREVLESNQYPEIRFKVQNIRGTVPKNGSARLRVGGIFGLHGTERPVDLVIPVEVRNGLVTADAQFPIPYVGWGLKDPSTFLLHVSDSVDVVVHAVGRLISTSAPSSTPK